MNLSRHKEIKNKGLKHEFKKIIMGYEISNNDFGFFAEFKEVFYPVLGKKILTTQENINYTFQEVEYYLLEDNTVARFIKKYTPTDCSRELLQIYSLEIYNTKLKKQKIS